MGRVRSLPELSFDPAAIPAALRRAGFEAREIRLEVVGEIVRGADDPVVEFEAGGGLRELLLRGDLAAEIDAGRSVRLRGILELPGEPRAPLHLAVEEWEPVPAGTP